jgi:pentafunctional AROM polypeptide
MLTMSAGTAVPPPTVLVVPMSDASTQTFLQRFSATNKVNVQRVDVEAAATATAAAAGSNALAVVDAGSVTDANASALRQLNAVYLMAGGAGVGASSAARNACKYDVYLDGAGGSDAASRRLDSLLQRLRAPAPTPEDTLLDAGEWSHFLSLTFPSIDAAVPVLPALRVGVDAFELRVDLLEDISAPSLHRQIALLRDTCPLPIVFTVRSVGQIGKFPPEPERIFALLREGLRAGCEWVDVEACWPADQLRAFTALAARDYACTSRLLGSLHVTTPQTRAQVDAIFQDCDLFGAAHVLKAVTGAANDADCQLIHAAGAAGPGGKPYIGVCLGADGARSRVLNRRFTPVTHKLMAAAAPGQLTVEQLMERRAQEGLLAAKQYYLFGTPIQQSLSPAMHNGAFDALLLPHRYGLSEHADAAAYVPVMADPAFGGASVTIPHKEAIIPLIDEVRGAAVDIGAVNTVVVEASGRKVGYNTDWLGIKRPVLRQLRARGVPWANTAPLGEGGKRAVGVVVGAGGTAKAACYAVRDLGLDVVVCNRSPDKAEEVARAFGGRALSLDALAAGDSLDPDTVQLVISTLPAQAGFTLPPRLLETAVKPVILDVVYKPARTQLIEQAMANGCLFVQGATMLLEQGLEQFELWHRRRAPRAVMDAAVFNGVERLT